MLTTQYLRETGELMGPGHLACQGCGATMAMRLALKGLGKKTVIAMPACCWSVIAGPFPHSNLGVPLYHCAFETAAATASGIRAGLNAGGKKDTIVAAWAGDGGTFDIGIQALSGAAERNEDIIYVCYDNEAYMNTGIQRSSATPRGAWTTTTPEDFPKEDPKKDIDMIIAAHKVPYLATTSVAFPLDLVEKFRKAREMKGTRFIHILSPCPPGWRIPSEKSIELTRMATDAKIFPIFEVFNGKEYRMNILPKGIPVIKYMRLQGRFKHLTDQDINAYQKEVDARYDMIARNCGIL
jgi:pyruvate/2-oxoacid:ferredoxin oxidoreductase beta subunit